MPTPKPEPKAALIMVPETSLSAPASIAQGGELAFTVRVLTSELEITLVSLAMGFDPTFLEVVDIEVHPDNPVSQFTSENVIGNDAGTILFTAGGPDPVTYDFDVVIITFRSKSVSTEPSSPTEVIFIVDERGDATVISKSGKRLLGEKSDFTGAFIQILAP